MKPRHAKTVEKQRKAPVLKDARRENRCQQNLSRKLPNGEEEVPGPRGACSPESSSQGSE
jgi:hypothetical protein